MNSLASIALLLTVLVVSSSAFPRNVKQQRPVRYYPAHQAMLVQFHQPRYASRRSSQEVAAFASGDEIEGATYIQDEPIADQANPAPAPLLTEEIVANELDAPIPAVGEEFPPIASDAVPSSSAADEDKDDDDDDDDDEDETFVPVFPMSKKSGKQPPHTFFPMSFGRNMGGSIAVANSFSTGKGSSASHAVAYGGSRKNRE